MKIKCPACSQVLNIPDSAAGKVVKCPCGKQLRAPGAPASPAAPTAGARPAPARPAAARPTPARPTPARPTPARPAAGPAVGGDFDPGMFDELTDGDLQPVKSVTQPGRGTAAPRSTGGKLLQQYASTGDARADSLIGPKVHGELASVGSRIVGTLIDGVFHMFFVGIGVAIMVAMLAGGGEEGPDPATLASANYVILGSAIIPAIINATLISMSGQTVGKKIVGTRIVSQGTGAPSGFLQGFLIRNVGFGFFTGIPILGLFIAIADVVYLFLDDHETLHDKLAKTMVVRA